MRSCVTTAAPSSDSAHSALSATSGTAAAVDSSPASTPTRPVVASGPRRGSPDSDGGLSVAAAGDELLAAKLSPYLPAGKREARILRLLQQSSQAAPHVVQLRLAREVDVKATLPNGTEWPHRAMLIVTKWVHHVGLFGDVAADPERSVTALMTILCRRVYGLLQVHVLIAARLLHSFLAQPCYRLAPHVSIRTACAVATPPPHAIRCNTVSLPQAIAAWHACGVVHLDIKPKNVAVVHVNGSCTVQLLDADCAYTVDELVAFEDDETLEIGTENYMAPEMQNRREAGPVTPLADVWSAGTTIRDQVCG